MSITALPPSRDRDIRRRERRIVFVCLGIVGFMVAMSYAAVPLYDLFCRVTGYGGTTQVAEEASYVVLDRDVTVRFDASLSRDMPWRFDPVQGAIDVKVGEQGLALYRATNPTSAPVTGTATFNVTPQKAGAYFSKLECFCFTEQTLMPGESVDMPVSFYVDPAIADDPDMDDIRTITLSYTFFPVAGEGTGG